MCVLTIADREVEELLRWLSPLEPQKTHQDIRSKRMKETGDWLLQTTEFLFWRDSENESQDMHNVLGCYGIPGAGKTVIR